MEEIIQIKDQFYVLATSSLADQRTRVLKNNDTLGVFDVYGDIRPIRGSAQGLFDGGTRHLSYLYLRVGANRPLLLSSTVKSDNSVFTVDLTNPDIIEDGKIKIPRGVLHLERNRGLRDHGSFEEITVTNFENINLEVTLSLSFGADFTDIFEIRGIRRERRGETHPPVVDNDSVIFSYLGLDGALRKTRLHFSPRPTTLKRDEADFLLRLSHRSRTTIRVELDCESPGALEGAGSRKTERPSGPECFPDRYQLASGNMQFNDWLDRSRADLQMMTTCTSYGPYPYAGVPWFNTVFGRDGIITALQTLWLDPDMAKGVLGYLAATQATETDASQDAEPGKILHEFRKGEMVAAKEVPFERYYGSVDSTPLFLVLVGAYYERTGDRAFVRSIWRNVLAALEWIDRFGDRDGDGFVEYARNSRDGLTNQGWKDSADSVFHADGSLAEGPIALCEVQGYVYDAKERISRVAGILGELDLATRLAREAEELRKKFTQAFWCEDLQMFGLALDGRKKICRVRSSNAGQVLASGIAGRNEAGAVADSLFQDDMFSGWGVRTVSSREERYNPMSYHNGAIWPHDNAMIAQGLAAYGKKERVAQLLESFFHVSSLVELNRLPELFCGFVARAGEGPTLYPVACSPQSWASGAVYMFLQSMLGVEVNGTEGRVRFVRPLLPDYIPWLEVRGLTVGAGRVDILCRHGRRNQATIEVIAQEGEVSVEVVHRA